MLSLFVKVVLNLDYLFVFVNMNVSDILMYYIVEKSEDIKDFLEFVIFCVFMLKLQRFLIMCFFFLRKQRLFVVCMLLVFKKLNMVIKKIKKKENVKNC